jgi:hypothetical protein
VKSSFGDKAVDAAFVEVSAALDAAAGPDHAKIAKAAQTSLEQLTGLESTLKGLVPPTEIGTDPSDLYVAAARIEFATVAAK